MPQTPIELRGCSPVPLAAYLKALGALRLLGEQADETAAGFWRGDTFYLQTTLAREELVSFFLNRYRPSPIVAPWNGGSGFNPKDNKAAIEAIQNGKAERFDDYRATILTCHNIRRQMGLEDKVDASDKQHLLITCRNRLDDRALTWLDAAFVLTGEGPKYPPLLGTGGNDGRLDFTNNYMQRLLDLFDTDSGIPSGAAATWLSESLFYEPTCGLIGGAIGQFDPGRAGGANSTTGFDAGSLINPWDFVFMLEGAMMFAAAAVKRLEQSAPGTLSYPFAVRQVGVGYGSAANSDEKDARAEMWLPLWEAPANARELSALFAEGRSQVGRRRAANGVDFARAVAGLGTDRGIRSFQRFGFQARNGLAYFAVPLSRFEAKPQPEVNLLNEIDDWLVRFRGRATADAAPARAGRALRRLESAIMELCQRGGRERVADVLVALGKAEAAMVVSMKWTSAAFLRPIPPLSPQWLTQCDDGSREFRLAAALASVATTDAGAFRQHFEPVNLSSKNNRSRAWWKEQPDDDCNVVWGSGELVRNLCEILRRRIIATVQSGEATFPLPKQPKRTARLDDVIAFITGDVDDSRVADLLQGLILIDWPNSGARSYPSHRNHDPLPPADYGMLKLCHHPARIREQNVKLDAMIARRAIGGDLSASTKLASRRLRGSGLPPAVSTVFGNSIRARRIAAALLFPLHDDDVDAIANSVLKPRTEEPVANS